MDIVKLIETVLTWFTVNGGELTKSVLALVTAGQILVALLKTLLDQFKQGAEAIKAFRQ